MGKFLDKNPTDAIVNETDTLLKKGDIKAMENINIEDEFLKSKFRNNLENSCKSIKFCYEKMKVIKEIIENIKNAINLEEDEGATEEISNDLDDIETLVRNYLYNFEKLPEEITLGTEFNFFNDGENGYSVKIGNWETYYQDDTDYEIEINLDGDDLHVSEEIIVEPGHLYFDEDNHPTDGVESSIRFRIEKFENELENIIKNFEDELERWSENIIEIKKRIQLS